MYAYDNMNDLSWRLAYESLKYLASNGPIAPAKEVYSHLEGIVKTLKANPELLKVNYESHDGSAYIIAANFKLVGYAKAGFIKKSSPKRGYWTITDEGLDVIKKGKSSDELRDIAHEKYWLWKNSQTQEKTPKTENEKDVNSLSTVRDKLVSLDAYDFQDLTAGLLEGMGYFVDFNSERLRWYHGCAD